MKAKPSRRKRSVKVKRPKQNDLKPKVVLPYIDPSQVVVGIDEVGRGAWAGPLVVAAVILRSGSTPEGVTDSKLLSSKKRTKIARLIKAQALAIGIGWVPAHELDKLGLSGALTTAAERAVIALEHPFDLIVIDGSINLLPGYKTIILPKADLHIPQVAAASIIAKVARDNYMHLLHLSDARYRFDRHVGYGTSLHAKLLVTHGPSLNHRYCFKPVKLAAGLG